MRSAKHPLSWPKHTSIQLLITAHGLLATAHGRIAGGEAQLDRFRHEEKSHLPVPLARHHRGAHGHHVALDLRKEVQTLRPHRCKAKINEKSKKITTKRMLTSSETSMKDDDHMRRTMKIQYISLYHTISTTIRKRGPTRVVAAGRDGRIIGDEVRQQDILLHHAPRGTL